MNPAPLFGDDQNGGLVLYLTALPQKVPMLIFWHYWLMIETSGFRT